MKTAIVTGASGFVGYHLCNELLASGYQITALCRKGSENNQRIPQEVRQVFSLEELPKADIFFHLAWDGASGVGRANAEMQSNNVTLAIKALETAEEKNCGKFVLLGTVYEKFAQTVKHCCEFKNADFYILGKEYAHSVTNQLSYKLGIDYVCCTVCHPVGKYVKPEQIFASVVRKLRNGMTVEVSECLQPFDIIAVEDLVNGIRLCGETKLKQREYYIGSGQPKILKEYFLEARKILGVETPLEFGKYPFDGLEFQKEWFDISRLIQETGYKSTKSLDDIIKGLVQ
jgi:nucleoside-diphosphate-sugar epimerase